MLRSFTSALCLSVFVTAHGFADVQTISYFGGTGDDAVNSAAFTSDGSIIIGGTSTSPTLAGSAGTRLGDSAGFVAKLNATATAVQWLVRLPAVKKVQVGPQDALFVLLDRTVSILKADGSGYARQGADIGTSTVAMDVAPDGSVALLDATNVRFIEPNGAERWNKAVGRSHLLCVGINPVTKDVWVGGDQNTNTGFEPWRSPFLFQYTAAAGDRTLAVYDWPGPAVRANGRQLQADSFVEFIKFSGDGRIWIGAGSDGGNTVLTKEPDSLDLNQDALSGSCFSGPCFGYKGAKKTGLFARMKSSGADMERASWVIPYVGMNPGSHVTPACGCKGADFQGTGVNPGSFGVSGILPIQGGAIILGNPWGKAPVTQDGWFYNTCYFGGGIGWVATFDDSLNDMSQASMIPGTRDAYGDVQNGRLLVAGRAVDFSTATVDTSEATWNRNLPATANALQKAFGGGASDGYVILATVNNASVDNRRGRPEPSARRAAAAVVLKGRGLLLGPGLSSGTYALLSLSGAVMQSGAIAANRLIALDPARAHGACVLRVRGAGLGWSGRITVVE